MRRMSASYYRQSHGQTQLPIVKIDQYTFLPNPSQFNSLERLKPSKQASSSEEHLSRACNTFGRVHQKTVWRIHKTKDPTKSFRCCLHCSHHDDESDGSSACGWNPRRSAQARHCAPSCSVSDVSASKTDDLTTCA